MQQQLDRMEEMLTSLISIVGNINSEQKLMKAEQMEMKKDISEIKAEQMEMRKDISEIKAEQLEMKKDISEMKKDISEMKAEQVEMKNEIFIMKEEMKLMRVENEKRHSEVMNRFHTLEADHEHTWEKTVKNEREFAVFKKQFELQNTDV